MYWALHEIWELEKYLKGTMSYLNIPRELNTVADNMCHQALEAKMTVTFLNG